MTAPTVPPKGARSLQAVACCATRQAPGPGHGRRSAGAARRPQWTARLQVGVSGSVSDRPQGPAAPEDRCVHGACQPGALLRSHGLTPGPDLSVLPGRAAGGLGVAANLLEEAQRACLSRLGQERPVPVSDGGDLSTPPRPAQTRASAPLPAMACLPPPPLHSHVLPGIVSLFQSPEDKSGRSCGFGLPPAFAGPEEARGSVVPTAGSPPHRSQAGPLVAFM